MSSSTNLPFLTRLIYGSGDWGLASSGLLRQIFYAIFLTDVVGLDPRVASFGALGGIAWDAINDPLVGMLSDRVRSRWGRRRPFLLIFAIPFGLSYLVLWTAPAWESQLALILYVTLAFMLADTLSTLISVPYISLTPDLAPEYDQRTTLTGFRTFFQLAASLTVVVAAPMIVNAAVDAGLTQQQGYLIVASIFGTLGAIPFLLIFAVVRERVRGPVTETLPIGQTLRAAWANIPFRYAVGIHLLNWSAVDMLALIVPYYLIYWVGQGNLFVKVNMFGIDLALQSAFFGLLMLTCIFSLPLWLWLSQRFNKRDAYLIGMTFWVVVELLLFTVQPGAIGYLLALAVLAGIGVSSAYVLPDSIFPDIIEWAELRTGRRQEGIYYGARSFIRKLTGGLTIFFALQLLGWAGYQTPPPGARVFQQGPEALLVIRLLLSPAGALLLFGAASVAWFYPLTRERHARIRMLLAKRREKSDVVGL